jgi:hypothetical protein
MNKQKNLERFSRGQLYSSDALLALVVFALALALVTGLTTHLVAQTQSENNAYYRTHASENLLENILSSSGSPVYWDSLSDRNGVKQIGLIDHEGGISTPKWNAFVDWNGDDYPSLKEGLRIPDYHFYLTISDSNHGVIARAGTAPIDSNEVSVSVLPSFYKQKPVFVQVQVYK